MIDIWKHIQGMQDVRAAKWISKCFFALLNFRINVFLTKTALVRGWIFVSCPCLGHVLLVFFPEISFEVIASSLGTIIPVRSFDVIFVINIYIFLCPAKPDEIT